MLNYILEVRECDEFGGLGLTFQGSRIEEYNPCQSGRLLAHDLLEHHKLEIGGVGEELKAMGAAWYIRGQFEDITRPANNNTSYDHLASDVGPDLYMKWLGYGGFGCSVGSHVIDCAHSFELRQVIEHAKELTKQEYPEDFDLVKWAIYSNQALCFMIKGYQLAAKRFNPIGGASIANSLFWNIAREADECINQIEYEGQQFKLSIELKSAYAHMREFYSLEDYS